MNGRHICRDDPPPPISHFCRFSAAANKSGGSRAHCSCCWSDERQDTDQSTLASPPPFSSLPPPPAPQGGPGTLSHRCQTSMQTADLCLLLSLSSYLSLFLFLDICKFYHRCKTDIGADCKCVYSSRKTAICNQLCPSFSSASHFQLQRKLKPADRGKVGTVTGQRKLPASTHPLASLMVMMMMVMMVMMELSLSSASLPLQLTGKLAS